VYSAQNLVLHFLIVLSGSARNIQAKLNFTVEAAIDRIGVRHFGNPCSKDK
jgi:hypothetical protein